MSAAPARILVIRHGALGDFISTLGPFRAIRAHHLDAHIVLLTTMPFVGLARRSGYFDEIWTDERTPFFHVRELLALRRRMREAGFTRIYDLQTSQRSSLYFHLLRPGPRPEWSGIANGASHRHTNPDRKAMHNYDRQADQLGIAGIDHVPPPDITFLTSDIRRFGLPADYILLVPGGSAHRPEKRWPGERYSALARACLMRGATPVLIGAAAERELLADIAAEAPGVRNLGGKTDFADLAELGRHARAAVGNDTGPMHLIAVAGCLSVILFSGASSPKKSAPRGERIVTIQRPALADLDLETVVQALPL